MAYTTIKKSSDYFDTKVYTGNGSSQTLDMDNLGLLWMKNRTETSNHNLFDVVRGGYYTSAPGPNLRPNDTTAGHGSDITSAYGITFGSSSSTIGSDGGGYNYNQNSKSYVGWQWRANGSGSSNSDGTITSTVSANTTSGFSIVKYVGNASAGATIGHGLGVVPKVMIVKSLSGAYNWGVYHASLGSHTKYLYLDASNAVATDSGNFDNVPTSSTFLVGSNNTVNKSGDSYIAYCFAEKTGYSKFGSYAGNGNVDGNFVYTGFKPSWIMFKRYDTAGEWLMYDNKRDPHNLVDTRLEAQDNFADSTSSGKSLDFLSNGFKIRGDDGDINTNGGTYIYMAFAEEPLVGDNPATAR